MDNLKNNSITIKVNKIQRDLKGKILNIQVDKQIIKYLFQKLSQLIKAINLKVLKYQDNII
jgi:hypothetical protein